MSDDHRSSRVVCGFAEPTDDLFADRPFVSKVGGKPRWLVPERLPQPASLECPKCRVAMLFLAQAYAPLDSLGDDDGDRAYHRSVLVFCCKGCSTFRAFRCQLPRVNDYYVQQQQQSGGEETLRDGAASHGLCEVCGCAGYKVCSKCHEARYCCEHHQRLAWNAGHREQCRRAEPAGWLFKEMEIETNEEPEHDPVGGVDPDQVARAMAAGGEEEEEGYSK